jgi:peptidoglycan/LPS O-acetylase OafA/YrhL
VTNRIAYIDGLRGVAALGVLEYHLTAWWGLPEYVKGPVRFAVVGQHGVELFFVLSGFCLSWPILQKLRNADYAEFGIAEYFARRFVRILPPYYVTILVLVGLGIAEGKNLAFWDVLRQALFLDKNVHFLEPPFWTLGIEFRWYFMFPLLVMLFLRAPRAFLIGIGVVILAFEMTVAWSADLGTLPAFALGIVAADLHGRVTLIHRRSQLLLACLFVFYFASPQDVAFDNFAWTLGMFAFVVSAEYTPWMRFLLSTPLMTSIGTISYSLYLINQPIIDFVHPMLAPRIGLVAASAATGVAAVLGGACFYFAAEHPFLTSWKGFLVSKITGILTSALRWMQIPQRISYRR